MINAKLIEHVFKAASILRWNDYPKMVNLVEIDKQAHKFIIAYFIAKFEKDVDMNYIIEGGIFEFFTRVVVTDIRPNVFHEIQKSKSEEVNKWVLEKLEPLVGEIDEGKFFKRLKNYFNDKTHEKECLILKAASYLATKWEFSIVYQTSQFLADIEELKAKVDEELEDYYELIGVRKIAMNQKLAKIVDLSGRLRFQRRWAQTQRIPQTNVLGHMLVVAIFGYFYCLEIHACKKRMENNFYCALFHDLPESLTRDIISPVKYGINGLDKIISEYEMRLIDDKILPLVPSSYRAEFSYILGVREELNLNTLLTPLINEDKKDEFEQIMAQTKDEKVYIKDEFENRILVAGKPMRYEGSMQNVNDDVKGAIDGKALKYCDKLAAYVEALLSISYGIKSSELISGFKGMEEFFASAPSIENVNFYAICRELKEYLEVQI